MRKGWLLPGVVVGVVGLVLLGVGVWLEGQSSSVQVPAGSAWSLAATSLNPETATLAWSGGTASTHVYLVTGTPGCSAPPGLVVSGAGSTGAFTVTFHRGTTYYLYACNGTSFQAGNFTLTLSGGVTVLDVGGLAAVGAGLVLVGLSFRPRRRPRSGRSRHEPRPAGASEGAPSASAEPAEDHADDSASAPDDPSRR